MHGMRDAPGCLLCAFRPQSVFRALEAVQLRELDQGKIAYDYNPGQKIFYEGNPCSAIYCIYAGRVKLSRKGKNGDDVVSGVLGPGAITGYRALLANEPLHFTATATEPTTVCAIPSQTVFSLIRSSPALAFRIMAELATRLGMSEDLAVTRTRQPARQRLARLLISLLQGPGGGRIRRRKIAPNLLHSEMAGMIGTTPETFSRVLHELERKGVLELNRRSIVVRKTSALRRIAEGRRW